MPLSLKDRVKQVTNTRGTGALTLVSTPSGFRSFGSCLSNGDTTYYCIESGFQWEVGIGTYSSDTLARTTVLASSNSNSLIDINATRSFVFISYVADKAVYKDSSSRTVIGAAGLIFSDSSIQTTAATTPDLSPYLTISSAASTYLPLAGGTLTAPTSTDTPLIIKGAASQSAALLDLRNSAGTSYLSLGTSTTYPYVSLYANPSQSIEPSFYGYGWYFTNVSGYRYAGLQTAYGPNQLSLASTTTLSWSSGTDARNAGDLHLVRVAANTLGQQNSTTAQAFHLYNTYTSATSYETLQLKAVAGAAYQIGSAIGSAGGTTRSVDIGSWNSAGTFASVLKVNPAVSGISNPTINVATDGSFLWDSKVLMGPYDGGSIFYWYAYSGLTSYAFLNRDPYPSSVVGNTSLKIDATSACKHAFNLPYGTASPASLYVGTNSASDIVLAVRGFSGQTANLTEWQNNSGTTLASISASGVVRPAAISVPPSTTSPSLYASNTFNSVGFWCSGDSVGTCYGGGTFMSYVHTNPGATCTFNYNTNIVLGTDTTYARINWGSSLSIGIDGTDIFAQRRGTNAQTFRLAETYTSSTSFGAFQIKANAGAAYQIGSAIGSAGGTNRGINFGCWDSSGTFTSYFTLSGTTSNSIILGVQGTTAALLIQNNGSNIYHDATAHYFRSLSGGTTYAQVLSSGVSLNLDLLFTDATYDIGKSGATRPRHGYFSGNIVLEGTITANDSISCNTFVSATRYASNPYFRFRRAEGSSGSPTQVLTGQSIGALLSYAYHDGGDFHSSSAAGISFITTENITTTGQGTEIRFSSTSNGATSSTVRLTLGDNITVANTVNLAFSTSTGSKIGTATGQKIGFWNATPVVQQTTASTSASVVGGGGTTVTQTDTFDGYTLAQIVKALRTIGILA